MDALEFIRERNRMCKSFGVCCNNCPADKNTACDAFEWKEELVTIVEKWSKENPRKTRQSVFLEQYPEALVLDGGTLSACPVLFFFRIQECVRGMRKSLWVLCRMPP